jgi:type I restriction enzyme S subunit
MSETDFPWPTLPLGKLAAEMCLGKMLDKQKNRGTLQPYLRNVNVRWLSFDLSDMKEMRFEAGEESRFGLHSGDLVICEGGEPGRAAVWKGQNEGAKIQKALHRVRFRSDEYAAAFAMYYIYFGTLTNRFAEHYTGTTIKHLTGKALSQVKFPIPPLNEQHRIVTKIEELFSDLDAGVAALTRVKAKLKRYRAAVLKAAVEGKLTEEWRKKNRPKESGQQLLERILRERRRKWEEEQLATYTKAGKKPPANWKDKYNEPVGPDLLDVPPVPDTWAIASLDQLMTTVTSGSRDWSQYYGEGTGTFLMAQNVRPGKLDLSFRQCVNPPSGDRDRVRSQVRQDDILVTIVGANTGDVCRVPTELPEHYVCQSVALMRPVLPVLGRYLEVYLVAEHGGQKQFRRYIYGQGRPHLGFDQIRMTPVFLPPLVEQANLLDESDSRLGSLEHIEDHLSFQCKRATRLRQSILKQAFEGKLVPQDPKDEPASVLLERLKGTMTHDRAVKEKRATVATTRTR